MPPARCGESLGRLWVWILETLDDPTTSRAPSRLTGRDRPRGRVRIGGGREQLVARDRRADPDPDRPWDPRSIANGRTTHSHASTTVSHHVEIGPNSTSSATLIAMSSVSA